MTNKYGGNGPANPAEIANAFRGAFVVAEDEEVPKVHTVNRTRECSGCGEEVQAWERCENCGGL